MEYRNYGFQLVSWLPRQTARPFQTPMAALADLRQRGYRDSFNFETACPYCAESDLRSHTGEFTIDETYIFCDRSSCRVYHIILAVTAVSGLRGIVEDHFPYEESGFSSTSLLNALH